MLGSYLTRVLHTARISNVKIILNGEKMKAGECEDEVSSMSRVWDFTKYGFTKYGFTKYGFTK